MPTIDVIIPTFNCEKNIDQCLRRIELQDISGDLNVLVVDGGSTDSTLERVRDHGVIPILRSGQYATGLTGARHYGEVLGRAPFLWYVDSDNFLVEESVASSLLKPLEVDSTLTYSYPLTSISPKTTSFNRWLSFVEKENVEHEIRRGTPRGGYVEILEARYGLTNCSLIRRSAALSVGGYDSDVRMLIRLRRSGIARAAAVPSAHIWHEQATGPLQLGKKLSRRLKVFGKMSDADIVDYFVDTSHQYIRENPLRTAPIVSTLNAPFAAIINWARTGDSAWLWGLTYPFVIMAAVMVNPVDSYRALSRAI
ncbi:MAG: glycosyltransferase [Thermoplasmata archaeon]